MKVNMEIPKLYFYRGDPRLEEGHRMLMDTLMYLWPDSITSEQLHDLQSDLDNYPYYQSIAAKIKAHLQLGDQEGQAQIDMRKEAETLRTQMMVDGCPDKVVKDVLKKIADKPLAAHELARVIPDLSVYGVRSGRIYSSADLISLLTDLEGLGYMARSEETPARSSYRWSPYPTEGLKFCASTCEASSYFGGMIGRLKSAARADKEDVLAALCASNPALVASPLAMRLTKYLAGFIRAAMGDVDEEIRFIAAGEETPYASDGAVPHPGWPRTRRTVVAFVISESRICLASCSGSEKRSGGMEGRVSVSPLEEVLTLSYYGNTLSRAERRGQESSPAAIVKLEMKMGTAAERTFPAGLKFTIPVTDDESLAFLKQHIHSALSGHPDLFLSRPMGNQY